MERIVNLLVKKQPRKLLEILASTSKQEKQNKNHKDEKWSKSVIIYKWPNWIHKNMQRNLEISKVASKSGTLSHYQVNIQKFYFYTWSKQFNNEI